MTIGLTKSRIERYLQDEGVEDKKVIAAVVRVISKNNDELEQNIKKMIEKYK